MSDVSAHRKISQYEWQDVFGVPTSLMSKQLLHQIQSAAAAGPNQALRKELLSSALTCSDRRAMLISGYDPLSRRCVRQVLEWDFSTRQWGPLPDIPQPFSQGAAVAYEEYCFAWGGNDGDKYLNTLYVLGPEEPEGAAVASTAVNATGSPMPAGPAAAAAGAAAPRSTKDMTSAPVSFSWSALPPAGTAAEAPSDAPSARCGHALVLATVTQPEGTEPVLYLFGGFDGRRRLNDVWRLWLKPTLEKREAVWERVHTMLGVPPSPRDDAAVAFDALQERLVVFGGFSEYLASDVHTFDLKEGRNQWRSIATIGQPLRRQGAVAVVSGRSLVVCGGIGENYRCLPQLLQLSLIDFRWSIIAADQCQELLGGRRGFIGGCGDRGRRILIYGGGQLPDGFNSSIVEIELERIDTAPKRK